MMMMMIIIIILLLSTRVVRSFTGRLHRQASSSTVTFLSASLGSNYEWLAEERYDQSAYKHVDWIDPSFTSSSDKERHDEDSFIVPIYPIPAVYLPFGNHILNNVEPRNLKMALDLNQTLPKLFCVTVVAADTGRIAKWGTLLRIQDLEARYANPSDHHSTLRQITVYCQAEGIVELCDIQNPVSRQQKLLRSSEYLTGRVKLRRSNSGSSCSTSKETAKQICQDWNMVKTLYELGIGGGSRGADDMPPKALPNLASAMLTWTEEDISITNFWHLAQVWQSVCLTIREGRQQLLNSDRNELMVASVVKKGGALKLPIHMEDLDPHDRRMIQDLEIQAQRNFLDLQMDPCLDFLAMMSLGSDQERFQWLGHLISRERQRLEKAARDFESFEECFEVEERIEDDFETEVQPRKGAWFDDSLW